MSLGEFPKSERSSAHSSNVRIVSVRGPKLDLVEGGSVRSPKVDDVVHSIAEKKMIHAEVRNT